MAQIKKKIPANVNHKNTKKEPQKKVYGFIITTLCIAIAAIIGITAFANNSLNKSSSGNTKYAAVKNSDLIIKADEVTSKANFYPVEIDGTKLEVIAVKASDGTIRTAFNTCQVCYSSGRGYYIQEGDVLVCQNCGNRFKMDQVEISKGGCNPVPIFSENKTVNGNTITISKDFLTEAKGIFANWKV